MILAVFFRFTPPHGRVQKRHSFKNCIAHEEKVDQEAQQVQAFGVFLETAHRLDDGVGEETKNHDYTVNVSLAKAFMCFAAPFLIRSLKIVSATLCDLWA